MNAIAIISGKKCDRCQQIIEDIHWTCIDCKGGFDICQKCWSDPSVIRFDKEVPIIPSDHCKHGGKYHNIIKKEFDSNKHATKEQLDEFLKKNI